ncbi:L,D-transpeptidase family protein [Myroides pelagicus]|uniref:L,D-transpeptidase family protein n=1 Tax=Myroides pelagicus TaxID=270914 RepID=A0A7K1GHY8_9FLAO|nr:L,D-transpeptidase family protein [Myroides pelagicus]MEC4112516.1 L,D-transpeptidase family protein [Myroides pelagicus]MTH28565.1 L,D-transpeptidase family protein [Myroides pelagicus]
MKKLYYILFLSSILFSCKDQGQKQGLDEQLLNDVKDIVIKQVPVKVDSLLLVKQKKEIIALYSADKPETLWYDNTNRQQYINVIENNYKEGILQKKGLHIDSLTYYHKMYEELNPLQKAQADILFNTSFLKNVNNYYNGVVNPRKISKEWDLKPKEIDASAYLLSALKNKTITQAFDSLRPTHQVYGSLKHKLEDLYKIQEDTLQAITQDLVLNDTIEGIKTLKKHLNFISRLSDSIAIDDIYNEPLKSSIEKFQSDKKLTVTGLPSADLVKAVVNEESRIKEKLILNLERWRWFPHDLGENYILINIPDFSLVTVAKQDTIRSHKVIVGTTKRMTPILTSKLTVISINPTWTVPPTILKNDVTPKAIKDSTYFNKRNFTIYERATGKEISPENWNAEKYGSYRYVQKGGPGNTLGRIKFMFNNNHSVYLHDTPNRGYFNRTNRNMSSGCVRVQDPFSLAEYIFQVQNKDISEEKIKEVLDSHETTNYGVSKTPIYIHQLYWTIQVDKHGKITEFKDVYNFDNDLYKRLK